MAVKASYTITLVRVNDGAQGPTGATGATGVGVKSSAVTYQASSSGTSIPTGTWGTTIPSVAAGQYLWTRTVITYTNNTTTTSYSVGKMGNTGATGATGSAGKGIKSTAVTYLAAANGMTTPTGTWSTSVPATTADKPYLWTRIIITYTDNTTSTSYSVGSTPEGIQVGGRNLLFGTAEDRLNVTHDEWVARASILDEQRYSGRSVYKISTVWNSLEFNFNTIVDRSELQVGDTLTYSIMAKMDAGAHTQGICLTANYRDDNSASGAGRPPIIVGTQWVKLSKTFTYTQSMKDRMTETLLRFGWEICGSSCADGKYYYFSSPKLELGNKATDWTPAPEDVQQGIDDAQSTADTARDTANNNQETIIQTRADLQILQNSIASLVTDENGASLMTQTSNGFTFNIGSIQSSLNNAMQNLNALEGDVASANSVISSLNSLTSDLAAKTAYIIMSTDDTGAPCIELGKEDNPFKVRITNTSIDFMEGAQKIAYITNHSLYIQSSVVTDDLQIGETPGWIWKKRANGNLGLRWKP
jgi:hypothetical protein